MSRATRDLSSAFGSAAAALRPARRRRRPAADTAEGTVTDTDDETATDTDTATANDTDTGTDTETDTESDTEADTDSEPDTDTEPDTDAAVADRRSDPIPTDDSTDHRTRTEDGSMNGRTPSRTGTTRRHERNGLPEPRRTRRRTGPTARRARHGEVRLRDARQLDLLILAIVEERPENGRVVHNLLRERSDGVFQPSLQGTYHRLHRLKNDRLITLGPARRSYRLTPLGERILAARRREWAAFRHGFDKVLGSPEETTR
ncbi:PadR family transcriptional regulator [Pseudonocardia halophobica]|uniref:PadR family transcriptional regulator n=1 Tax=Pseudonocardia halophobica TaxID=29401 RepID=UPI003D924C3E